MSNPNQPLFTADSQLAIANPADAVFQQQLDARQSTPMASPLAQPLSRTDVIFSVVAALAGVFYLPTLGAVAASYAVLSAARLRLAALIFRVFSVNLP